MRARVAGWFPTWLHVIEMAPPPDEPPTHADTELLTLLQDMRVSHAKLEGRLEELHALMHDRSSHAGRMGSDAAHRTTEARAPSVRTSAEQPPTLSREGQGAHP